MILHGPNSVQDTQPAGARMTGDLLSSIRRRKWLLLFFCVLGIAAGVSYQMMTPPIYQAETQILVMSRGSDLEEASGQRSAMDDDILSTHMTLFRSKKLIRAAIEKCKLDTRISSIKSAIADGQDAAKYIRDQLKVTRGGDGRAKDANILVATFDDTVAEDAATVLSALVVSYTDFLGTMYSDTSNEALELITEAQQKIAGDLDAHEKAYAKFREETPLLWKGNTATNLHNERLQLAERDLADVRRRSSEIRARLKVIEEFVNQRGAESVSDLDRLALLNESETDRLKLMFYVTKGDVHSEEFISEQPVRAEAVRTEYERLLSLRLKEETMSAKYGEDHPLVEAVTSQIRLVEKFLEENAPEDVKDKVIERMNPAEILETFLSVLKNDLSELQQREKELETISEREMAAAKELITYEIKDQSMQAETARLNTLYDAVVERLREVNLVRDSGGFMTEVMTPPEPPQSAAWPRMPISAGLGMALGLLLGGLFAGLLEAGDTTIRNPHELSLLLAAPILSHTPMFRKKRVRGSQLDPALITANKSGSMAAEAYRDLRTAVFFSAAAGELRVVTVTSPNPGDGKTTTSTNLAVTLANSGKRTLVVDCDMRRPRVNGMFGLKNQPGLSDVLCEQEKLNDALQSTDIENLDVLTAGTQPPNPSELLGSDNFSLLLNVLREKYDIIILDTPPVLAVSDARVASRCADGIILTLRVMKNGREPALRARELLDSTGAPLLGLVVNATSRGGRSEYGYRDLRTGRSSYENKSTRSGYYAYYSEGTRR